MEPGDDIRGTGRTAVGGVEHTDAVTAAIRGGSSFAEKFTDFDVARVVLGSFVGGEISLSVTRSGTSAASRTDVPALDEVHDIALIDLVPCNAPVAASKALSLARFSVTALLPY